MSQNTSLTLSRIGAFGLAALVSMPSPARAQTDCTTRPTLTIVAELKDQTQGAVYKTTTNMTSGQAVHVLVKGLPEYRCWYRKATGTAAAKSELAPERLRLSLDNQVLGTLAPTVPGGTHSHVTYDLGDLQRERQLHAASRETWRRLLVRGIQDVPIQLSIGFDGEPPLEPSIAVGLRAFPKPWFISWLVLAGALFITLVVAGRRTGLLRVPGPPPVRPAGATSDLPKAYSLARTQIAAWFFTVLIAYVLLWMVTGNLDTITPTVLGLLGISAATGLAATIIDTNGAPTSEPAPPSSGFLQDLVRENGEATLPRLQICVWTVVLIVIFGVEVYKTLLMPTFNETMLGLMAISGGTYVGFKPSDGKAAGK